jgi:hypothetical protein
MYRRNRYYDPMTGQFTQSDPVGIAGGLNVYGFASGDPVSYGDPFGLCPDHLWDKETQTCPGGMTHDEYYDVQDAIGTLRSGSERNRLQTMLVDGKIRKVGRTLAGRPAQAQVYYGAIDVTEGFFTGEAPGFETGYNTAGERGWVLGHEFGHILQWENGRLIREFGDVSVRGSRRRMLRLFQGQAGKEDPDLQGDADLIGCRLATDPGIWQRNCNR